MSEPQRPAKSTPVAIVIAERFAGLCSEFLSST